MYLSYVQYALFILNQSGCFVLSVISVGFMELFESLSLQDEHQLFKERIRINELLIDWHTGEDDMSRSQCNQCQYQYQYQSGSESESEPEMR